MDPFLACKNVLTIELSKQGHTLEDFESALSNLNTGEGVLETVKIAGALLDPLSAGLNLAGSVYLPTTMATGALVGLGVDKAEDTIKKQNKKLNEIRHNIKMLKSLKAYAQNSK